MLGTSSNVGEKAPVDWLSRPTGFFLRQCAQPEQNLFFLLLHPLSEFVGVGGLSVFILLLFCTPMMCWLISLFYATRVFIPRVRPDVNFNEVSANAWQKMKDAYGRVSKEKLRWLHVSHCWLIASFVLILLTVALLVLLPAAPTEPTQIIIITPTPTP
jgi:hypothetical protein